MSFLDLTVRRIAVEADGIRSFELVHSQGAELPAFTAGAHVDVEVAPGTVRQYSLCNDPAERHRWRIAVQREPASRGGSAGMHERIAEGGTLRVGAPRNLFELRSAQHSLLLAGGIGITPILAMAQALHRADRSFSVHYTGRTSARMAFAGELRNAPYAPQVTLHADDGSAGDPFDARATLSAQPAGTHLYICGPGGFMDHVLATARALGWAGERLHREYFTAAPIDASGGGPFEVRLARSGRSCSVPAGKTVLDVLTAAGVDIPFSCEAGVCGTCLTRVLEGRPDHRDSFLTEAERAAGDQFTPCCSRSHTPVLVLDL